MATTTYGPGATTHRIETAPFPPAHTESLIELGDLLVDHMARLARTIADESGRLACATKDPLFKPSPGEVAVINKRRRASRSFLVHLFRGELDSHFLSTLRGTWLPLLLGRSVLNGPGASRDLLDYIQGLLGGYLHSEPAENLAPRARIQAALSAAFDRMTASL